MKKVPFNRYDVDFHYNDEKRIVTAVLHDWDEYVLEEIFTSSAGEYLMMLNKEDSTLPIPVLAETGELYKPLVVVAKCAEGDIYTKDAGEDIAFAKLVIKYHKKKEQLLANYARIVSRIILKRIAQERENTVEQIKYDIKRFDEAVKKAEW